METSSSAVPYPPFELANRVLSLPSDDLAGYIYYEGLGALTKEELLNLLPDDYTFGGRRLLDFGCGAGRTMRHFLAEAAVAEVWGVDIDAESIAWMGENLCPPLNVVRCETEPPLDFESENFDFAWAISVFTHLPDNSVPWLLELHRILKPGGLLMASYMGRWNSLELAGEDWDEGRIGMNLLQHNRPWDAGGPMVFTSDWWVVEHWGRAFEIVARKSRVHNQTWVLLRKRDVKISVDELLAPSDDPREWAALQHNLKQVRREIEQGRNWAPENSLNWKPT